MKRKRNILTVLTLVAFYCISVGFSIHSHQTSESTEIAHHGHQEDHVSTAASPHSVHTPALQLVVSFSSEINFNSYAKHFDGFGAILCASASDFRATIKQCDYLRFNQTIRYRKSALIFPFHNFW